MDAGVVGEAPWYWSPLHHHPLQTSFIYLDEGQVPHDHLPHVLGCVHMTNVSLKDRQEHARSTHYHLCVCVAVYRACTCCCLLVPSEQSDVSSLDKDTLIRSPPPCGRLHLSHLPSFTHTHTHTRTHTRTLMVSSVKWLWLQWATVRPEQWS